MKRQEQLESGFITYMEEKYKEEFIFSELVGSHMGSNLREAYLKSASFPEERIWVERAEDSEGKVSYRDNFMSYYYREEIQKKILATTEEQFITPSVEYHPFQSTMISAELSPETLEQLLEKEDTIISVTISADSVISDRDNSLELWRMKLAEEKLRLAGKLILKDTKESCYYAMDSFYEFIYANWR